MSNTGKIARLPHAIREQLNLRLLDNQPAGPLLKWLNGQPPVQPILREYFRGQPITAQNLSEWRTGGFAAWALRHEVTCAVQATEETAQAIHQASAHQVADNLATILAGRYATLLSQWNGQITEAFTQQLRALRSLCHDITQLRKSDHSALKAQIAEEKQVAARGKTDEELQAIFQKWLKKTSVRKWVLAGYLAEDARAAGQIPGFEYSDRPPVPPSLITITSARQNATNNPEPLRDYFNPNEDAGWDDPAEPAESVSQPPIISDQAKSNQIHPQPSVHPDPVPAPDLAKQVLPNPAKSTPTREELAAKAIAQRKAWLANYHRPIAPLPGYEDKETTAEAGAEDDENEP